MLKMQDVYNIVDNPQKVYREFDVLRSAIKEDFKVVIEPVTFSNLKVATANLGGVQKIVTFDLVNSNGFIHDWYSGAMTITATKSSVAGTVSIGSTSLVDGKVAVQVTLGGTWVANDTFTLTITPPTVKGVTATVPVTTDVTTIIA
jgi:hypothetical protein